MVTSYGNSEVLKYYISGTYIGIFAADLNVPFSLLRIDGDTIAVATYDGVGFFDFEGNASTKYSTIEHDDGAYYLSLADDNGILFTDHLERVVKACLDNSCSQRTTIIMTANADHHLLGIAAIPNSDEYLVIDFKLENIYKCSMSNYNDCGSSSWEQLPQDINFHPSDVVIIDSIVYVADFALVNNNRLLR